MIRRRSLGLFFTSQLKGFSIRLRFAKWHCWEPFILSVGDGYRTSVLVSGFPNAAEKDFSYCQDIGLDL